MLHYCMCWRFSLRFLLVLAKVFPTFFIFSFQVADFGMSRNLANEIYYKSRGGKIPIRWTAPEVSGWSVKKKRSLQSCCRYLNGRSNHIVEWPIVCTWVRLEGCGVHVCYPHCTPRICMCVVVCAVCLRVCMSVCLFDCMYPFTCVCVHTWKRLCIWDHWLTYVWLHVCTHICAWVHGDLCCSSRRIKLRWCCLSTKHKTQHLFFTFYVSGYS